MRSLGAQRHLTVKEEQGHVELRVEGEAKHFLLQLCVRDREVPLRIVLDGVISGADCLNESVV